MISWDFSTFSSIWRFSLCRSFLASHYLAHLKQVLCRIFCNLIIIHKTSNWQKIRFTFIWNTTSRSLHPAVTSVRDRYYCWIWILPLERESWWSLSFKTLKGSGKILIKSTPPLWFSEISCAYQILLRKKYSGISSGETSSTLSASFLISSIVNSS